MLEAVRAAPDAAIAGWALAASLAAAMLAAALAWLAVRTRRLEQTLFIERMDRRHVEQLAPSSDGWLWQTDAQHRITRLQSPQPVAGARPAKSADQARQWLGQPIAQLLRCTQSEASLATLMSQQIDLVDIDCAWATGNTDTRDSPGAARRALVIRAVAQHDAKGRFRGYLGVLHANRSAGSVSEPAAAASPSTEGNAGTGRSEPLPVSRRQASSTYSNSTVAQAGSRLASGTAEGAGVTPVAQLLAAEQASFTYTVTHDLRAPIRVVEGFTRIVKEDYGHALDRVGIDHLDRVLGAAARMNAMIDALLGLSRLSQQPLARQPVQLSRLAEYIIDDLRRTSPERTVRVGIEPDLTVEGDPTLLRIVLENLLGNAWKYTGKVREAQITVRRDPSVPGLAFMVSDNGAGFDMRFADRLFGVFQRLHSASDFPGNGIGLASVQRIVRRHGGEIWAESEVGRGSTFHFTLEPVATAEAIAEDPGTLSDSIWPHSDLPAMPGPAAGDVLADGSTDITAGKPARQRNPDRVRATA